MNESRSSAVAIGVGVVLGVFVLALVLAISPVVYGFLSDVTGPMALLLSPLAFMGVVVVVVFALKRASAARGRALDDGLAIHSCPECGHSWTRVARCQECGYDPVAGS
jgi:predicted RNA-binding Zn-ribbon protein involved in translation (DUF1610 family)